MEAVAQVGCHEGPHSNYEIGRVTVFSERRTTMLRGVCAGQEGTPCKPIGLRCSLPSHAQSAYVPGHLYWAPRAMCQLQQGMDSLAQREGHL